ncbi:hypothetical protein T4C_5684 [Trichinella pseudospiralis]|uniref:Uncharacterized protein n=1 Tax=Trichinella pseudospiralis TaxID=6337 RepID=A0A0V1K588_TRIPS|nr:hypothetical protein T4C_5684 [Trichinella pseudospiralis]
MKHEFYLRLLNKQYGTYGKSRDAQNSSGSRQKRVPQRPIVSVSTHLSPIDGFAPEIFSRDISLKEKCIQKQSSLHDGIRLNASNAFLEMDSVCELTYEKNTVTAIGEHQSLGCNRVSNRCIESLTNLMSIPCDVLFVNATRKASSIFG